jgi:hypothetical protein
LPTIPLQPKVANSVGASVHLQRTPDGWFSAVSVLVQDRRIDFPSFWCDHCFPPLVALPSCFINRNEHSLCLFVQKKNELPGD